MMLDDFLGLEVLVRVLGAHFLLFGFTFVVNSVGCKRDGAAKKKKKKQDVKARPQKKFVSSTRSPAPRPYALPVKSIVGPPAKPPAAKVETPKPSAEVMVQPTASKQQVYSKAPQKVAETAPVHEETAKTSVYVRRGFNGNWMEMGNANVSEFSMEIDSNDLTGPPTSELVVVA